MEAGGRCVRRRTADGAGGGGDCRRWRGEGQRPAREKAGDGGRRGGRHGCDVFGKPTFFFICISSHLRPCGDGVATHPESGRRPLSSPTRELGRRSGVTDRGIDPEFCDYGEKRYLWAVMDLGLGYKFKLGRIFLACLFLSRA